MECLECKTNTGIMGFLEDEPLKLNFVIELIQADKPISETEDPWGTQMCTHEGLDGILQFMTAAFEGFAGGDKLSENQAEVFRGAGYIMQIAALLHRRLYQHSTVLLEQSIEAKKKKSKAGKE